MTFALLTPFPDGAAYDAWVRELFPSKPDLPAIYDVRDVSAVPGIAQGWVVKGTAFSAPAVVVPATPVPQSVSRRQFYVGLAKKGFITEQEALDALQIGKVPPEMAAFVSTLPAEDQFETTALLIGATEFQRSDELVNEFAAAQKPALDGAALDALWIFMGGL